MITSGLMSSEREDWPTPQYLFDYLDEIFHFTLDVCANSYNHKVSRYFDEKTDGLKQDWSKDVSFMNPPYGRKIPLWIKKAKETASRGGVVVALIPARTDTQWWGDVMSASEIWFIQGRVTFEGASGPAPFPSAIVVWGLPHVPTIKTIDNTLLNNKKIHSQKGTGNGTRGVVQNTGELIVGGTLDRFA